MARSADISNLYNSFVQAANTGISIANKIKEDQAELDLLTMKANLESNANKFMLELQTKSDYENWPEECDKFIKRQRDSMQRNSRNQYTANLADKMLTNWQGDFNKNVQLAAVSKAKENMGVQIQNIIDMNNNNSGLVGQNLIDSNAQVIDTGVINGTIPVAQADAMYKKNAEEALLKTFSNVTDDYTVALQNGESIESIINKFSGTDFNYSVSSINPNTTKEELMNGEAARNPISIDVNAIKESYVKNNLKPSLHNALVDFQNSNDKNMEKMFTDAKEAVATGSMQQVQSFVDKGLTQLNLYKQNDNALANGRLKYWTDCFTGLLGTLDNGGSGSGSSGNIKGWTEFLKNCPDMAIQWYLSGDNPTLYDATEAVKNAAYEYLTNVAGLSEEEAAKEYRESENVFKSLVREAEDKVLARYPELRTKLKKIENGVNEEARKYALPGTADFIVDYMKDLIMSGEQDPVQLNKSLDKLQERVIAGGVDAVLLNKKGNPKVKITDDKSYAKALQSVQDQDYVFTNTSGREVWYGDSLKALTSEGGLVPETQKRVAAALGIEVQDTGYQWKLTHNGTDITNIPIVKANGKLYEVKPEGKSYSIYEVEYKNGNYKEVGKVEKPLSDKEKASNAVKDADQKRMDFDEKRTAERKAEIQTLSYESLPQTVKEKYSENDWKMIDIDQKYFELQYAGFYK